MSICLKNFSITVEEATGVLDWSLLTWTNPLIADGPPAANVTMNPSVNPTTQNLFEASCDAKTPINFFPTIAQAKNTGSLVYNGPLVACTLHATLGLIYAVDGWGNQANWVCRIYGDHFAAFSIGGGGGANNYPFNIPDTGGLPKNIYVEFEVNAVSLEAGYTVYGQVRGIFS